MLFRELEHVLAALTPVNRLVARVCVATGLRIGDVVALRSDQLAPQFWIHESKTKKRRRVNLTTVLLEELKAVAGPVFVFTGAKGPDTHRTRQAVWKDVKRAARAFRLPQNVAPHSFRKVYAVRLMEKSQGDMTRVKRALNHSDHATTMLYAMAYELYRTKYKKTE